MTGSTIAHAASTTSWRAKSVVSCSPSKLETVTPPPFANHGNYIISLNRFVKWLGGLVEAEGVDADAILADLLSAVPIP